MSITVFKGDEVKLKTGEVGIVIETWGVAMDWFKMKSRDGATIYATSTKVDSILSRFNEKQGRKRR